MPSRADMDDSDDGYMQLPPPEDDDDGDYFELDSISNDLLHVFRRHSLAELLEPEAEANPATHPCGVTGRGDHDPALPVAATEEALIMKTVEAPSDGRDCPICLDGKSAAAATGAWAETRCGHSFHGRCVERWLQAKGSCPMCRHQLLLLPRPPAAHQDLVRMDILDIYGQDLIIDLNLAQFPVVAA